MRVAGWIPAVAGLVLGAGVVALLPRQVIFTSPAAESAADAPTGERWACAMMDYIGSKPGDCPVCGMKLQKVTAGELNREQRRRMGIELATVTEGPATAVVRAYGTVRYDDRTARAIVARVAGRIVARHAGTLHAGTLVSAGDPLVDLYSPEAFAAQGELAAALRLGNAPAVDALTERFRRWNLEAVAQAILAGNEPVDTVTIRSPFDGRVVVGADAGAMAGQLPAVGQEIMPDQVVVQLIDPHAYMVVVQVPEPRARWVHAGQPVRLASDDRGELPEVDARVSWVAPELNREIRSREVHLHLVDPRGALLPGSLVNARFQAALGPDLDPVDPEDGGMPGRFVLVPKTAVLSTGVRHVAWRVAERRPDGRMRFELASLALGPRIEDEAGRDLYVVRSGLEAGDEVATQGLFLIDSQAQLAGSPSLLFPQGAVAPQPAHEH